MRSLVLANAVEYAHVAVQEEPDGVNNPWCVQLVVARPGDGLHVMVSAGDDPNTLTSDDNEYTDDVVIADGALDLGTRTFTHADDVLADTIRAALEGESNDAEHDALVLVAEYLGVEWLANRHSSA